MGRRTRLEWNSAPASSWGSGPGTRWLAVAAGTLVSLALGAAGVLAAPAEAAPSWKLEVSHANPYGDRGGVDPFTGSAEAFDRKSGFNAYAIVVRNVGTTAVPKEPGAGQEVTVQDKLPEGLAAAGPAAGLAFGEGWKECGVTQVPDADGQPKPRLVTCTRRTGESALAPGEAYKPITVHVYVEEGAANALMNEVSVSGGEASPSQESATDPTAIEAAVPFGIFEFEQAATKEPKEPGKAGEPETQAGGHPFALDTGFQFNFTTSFEGKLLGAGGGPDEFGVGPKETEVELPPGMIGNPQNVSQQCELQSFLHEACSEGAAVGYIHYNYTEGAIAAGGAPKFESLTSSLVYNVEPPPGHPAAFGFFTDVGGTKLPFLIYPRLRSDGDYGLTVGDEASGPLRSAHVTFCSFGVEGVEGTTPECKGPEPTRPFLSNPTQCAQAPMVGFLANPYPAGGSEPTGNAEMETYLNGPSGPPASVGAQAPSRGSAGAGATTLFTECQKLSYKPQLHFQPTSAAAGAPSGMTFTLEEHEKEIEPSCTEVGSKKFECPPAASTLKDLSLTMPEGVTLSPAGAGGLTACQNLQFGLGKRGEPGAEFEEALSEAEGHGEVHRIALEEPAQEGRCPSESQVGTVEVTSPDLPQEKDKEGHRIGPAQLKGALYVGQPECSPCSEAQAEDGQMLRLFLELKDRKAGLIVKLVGHTSLNGKTGRLTTTFDDQPQLPFEKLVLTLKNGPRAPLSNPQSCSGAEQTIASITPWSFKASQEPQTEPIAFEPFSCPTGPLPFAPSFGAGTRSPAAGQYSPFALSIGRTATDEQNLEDLEVHMPPGLTAKIAGIPLCEEAQANAGTCQPASQIGNVTVGVGAGTHPFYERGNVFLTGPYSGPGGSGPFGLSIVVPTTAGPFTLKSHAGGGEEVVRAAIEIDERTAAVTVKSNPIPQMLDGVPLRIAKLNVEINRASFELNPTDCRPRSEGVTAALVSSSGAILPVASSFDVGGCRALSFKPTFTATTQAKVSRTEGASLTVKVGQSSGEADIAKTDLQLPSVLPSRLTTLQHACTEREFAELQSGKAGACPVQSYAGTATARTPLLSAPLTGPAILVSHGGQQFPDLNFLLEGEGVKIDLVGHTQIKKGITYSRFEEVPDTPITSFETSLPEGPHSLLAANGDLCTEGPTMPTTIVAQNGAQVTRQTKIKVTGCPKAIPSRTKKLKAALRACRRKHAGHAKSRAACERRARRRYAARPKKATAASVRRASPASLGVVDGGTAAGGLTGSSAAPAIGADTAEAQGCSNAARRAESTTDPATGEPYAEALGECRAYEVVSPLDKQGHNIELLSTVAANGNAVGFTSQGGFSEPENFYEEGAVVQNSYVARRETSNCPGGAAACWVTISAAPPAGFVEIPNLGAPLQSDFSPDLRSAEVGCGLPVAGDYACAVRRANGSWAFTNQYWPVEGMTSFKSDLEADVGESEDLSRIFIMPGIRLMQQDHTQEGGIYELSGLQALAAGTGKPQLRLVNMDAGHDLRLGTSESPLLGNSAINVEGSASEAVSRSGEVVLFTADPFGTEGPATIFARVPCSSGPNCESLIIEGHAVPGSGRETVTVSSPECEGLCTSETPRPAVFEGASSDGSKVFFTTEQELLPSDRDDKNDLYEAELTPGGGRALKLLSYGEAEAGTTQGNGAEVRGTVRISEDGSHVYFVASGVLTTVKNSFGAAPLAGQDNLYVADTVTGKVGFIATLPAKDGTLWGEGCGTPGCDNGHRHAQTTPDGRDLIFETHARLDSKDANGCKGTIEGAVEICSAEAVYRYDAQAGQLTWISHTAGVAAVNEAKNAEIAPPEGIKGSMADYSDTNRSMSGCPQPAGGGPVEGCASPGEHDGEDVVFTTSEALAPSDADHAEDVYLWHCASPCQGEGTVSLISAGAKGTQASAGALSASGEDVFFTTAAGLVPQDTDQLKDVYDARVGGGIAAPPAASCNGEECQGRLLAEGLFPTPGSSIFDSGQNVEPPPLTTTTTRVVAPKVKPKKKPTARQRRSRRKANARHRKGRS